MVHVFQFVPAVIQKREITICGDSQGGVAADTAKGEKVNVLTTLGEEFAIDPRSFNRLLNSCEFPVTLNVTLEDNNITDFNVSLA